MTNYSEYLKILTFLLLGLVWLTSLVILVTRLRKKFIVTATPDQDTQLPPRMLETPKKHMNGVHVVKRADALIISIDPEQLSKKLQLSMETTGNHLVMKILPGGIIHDPTPDPDVNEEEILSSQEEINNVISSNSPHS